MRVIVDRFDAASRARALIVLLPAAMQQPEDLLQAGFAAAVRERRLSVDLALVDFELTVIGDSTSGAAVRLLHERLLQSLATGPYEKIWLAGISLGGAIAASYADIHAVASAGPVAGLCLLAPYPGNRSVTNAIARAGGVAQWDATPSGDIDADDAHLWRWLKHCRRTGPEAYLAYGLQDRFIAGLTLMAEVLDAGCVDTVAGGHDMTTWVTLWQTFLDRLASRPDWNHMCP
jgi:pimeloyl-ACP methyl ester carboxylesterase